MVKLITKWLLSASALLFVAYVYSGVEVRNFTTALLASTRNTSMIGTLIVSSMGSSLVQEGASLVLLLLVALIVPMIYYLRSTSRATEGVSL